MIFGANGEVVSASYKEFDSFGELARAELASNRFFKALYRWSSSEKISYSYEPLGSCALFHYSESTPNSG